MKTTAAAAASAAPSPGTLGRTPTRRVRPVPAVSRAIAILRLLGRSAEPQGVKAIATSLELVPSTALHILRVLVDEGLVRVDGAKRYSLGSGVLSLARSLLAGSDFALAVQPSLDRIARKWRVTAIGVEIEGLDHMVVLALSKSMLPFRLHVDVGSRFPALISATGRLVAAFSREPRGEIERRFRSLRWQSPPEVAAWWRQVATARRQGYALDRGNYIAGATVLSVPVFDIAGGLTHTLVAAGMSGQFDATSTPALIADLKAEAGHVGAGVSR
jgi:DNA-binding IclR family transcriptional regulator